jgi:hypothetical protein
VEVTATWLPGWLYDTNDSTLKAHFNLLCEPPTLWCCLGGGWWVALLLQQPIRRLNRLLESVPQNLPTYQPPSTFTLESDIDNDDIATWRYGDIVSS